MRLRHTCAVEKGNFNVDFSVYSDISDAETLEMAVIKMRCGV